MTNLPVSGSTNRPRRQEVSELPPVLGGESVARVIANNRGMLQNCVDRALLRGDIVGGSKITIRGTVAFSGRLVDVKIDAAHRFRVMEPCLRLSLQTWAFPPKPKRYEIGFTLLVPQS